MFDNSHQHVLSVEVSVARFLPSRTALSAFHVWSTTAEHVETLPDFLGDPMYQELYQKYSHPVLSIYVS